MAALLETPQRPLSFTFDKDAALAAVLYISRRLESSALETVFALLYLADKKHLEDYGRFITGDKYHALEAGPVPSHIYDVLNYVAGRGGYLSLGDDFKHAFKESLQVLSEHYLTAKTEPDLAALSESDLESLDSVLHLYKSAGLEQCAKLSRDAAWEATPRNHEIPLERIAQTLLDAQQLLNYLRNPFPGDM